MSVPVLSSLSYSLRLTLAVKDEKMKLIQWFKQFFCIHADIVSFEKDHVRLQCTKCLRLTDGWKIERKVMQCVSSS